MSNGHFDDHDNGRRGRSEPTGGRSRRSVLYGVGALGAAGLLGGTGKASGSTGQARAASATQNASADQLPQGLFKQVQQLLADDGDDSSEFGDTIALDGDTALIGAPEDDNENGEDAGAAYVFVRRKNEWVQTQKLLADDGESGDLFGRSVALVGDTALIGAQTAGEVGAAYVFTRKKDDWVQTQRLLAEDDDESDDFGDSVALDGDTALIGADGDDNPNGQGAGAVYVFTRRKHEWSQVQKLLAEDGVSGARFGDTVALDGDTSLIGAPSDSNENGANAGAAYIFTRRNGEWSQAQKLLAADGEEFDFFSRGVALNKNTALVGAPENDNENGENAGAVYVFTCRKHEWSQVQKLLAEDGGFEDRFGNAIALDGNTALIGVDARFEFEPETGAAYVFTRKNGEWSQAQKLLAEDREAGDLFGTSVALAGKNALIGAPRDNNENGENAGSVYVFERRPVTDGYQVDFVGGKVIENLGTDEDAFYSAQNRLIRYVNGSKGDGMTASGTPSTLSKAFRTAIDSESITVDEHTNTASVSFRVSEESGPITLTFASYTLPGGEFTAATADQQVLTDFVTETFPPGEYCLTVALPDGGCDSRLGTPGS